MDGFESGRWQSGNDSVLSVNAITGEVHACGEGVAEGNELNVDNEENS